MTEYQFLGSKTAHLPYRPGGVYQLRVRPGRWRERMRGWNFIIEEPYYCPYTSMETFMQNWQLVSLEVRNDG